MGGDAALGKTAYKVPIKTDQAKMSSEDKF